MLDGLRRAAGTWVAKLLLLLLGVSFGAWGITGQMGAGVGGSTVLAAGNTEVSTNQYRLAYDRQVNSLSRQLGQRITNDQAKAFGVPDQVLGTLIAGAVLDEQARKLGLGLSENGIAQMTRDDPAFQGMNGSFDRGSFDYVLRQVGMRPEEYFAEQSRAATRQQIASSVAGGIQAPETLLGALARYQGEDRTIDYVVLPTSIIPAIEEPADDVLAKWFDEHKKEFAAPEYRTFEYVKLEPEDIADPDAITEKQIEEDYEARKARYSTPETRVIEQLVFPNLDAAKLALDQLRAGTTFNQLIEQSGKAAEDIKLGKLSKDQVPDAAIRDAAFALSVNQVSDVVEGQFGPVLLRVTEINPEVVKPLAEVSAEIRKELAFNEAHRVLMDSYSAYEDARAGGASLMEAATKLHLKPVTVKGLDRTGKLADGAVAKDLPSAQELINAVFDATLKTENQPVNTRENGYIFYEVTEITPARDRTLDEMKQNVVTAWKAAQLSERLEAKASELAKRINDGATVDAIATELKLEKQVKRGLKRDADDPAIGSKGVDAAFSIAKGMSGTAVAPDGQSRIVFKVAEVTEVLGADGSTLPDDTKKGLSNALTNDLLDGLVSRLRGEFDIEVNQTAIDAAMTTVR